MNKEDDLKTHILYDAIHDLLPIKIIGNICENQTPISSNNQCNMNKKEVEKKETMSEFMKRFDAVFSLSVREGWANVCFEKEYNGEIVMKVRFFDDEGRSLQDEDGDGGVPIETLEKVANFLKGLKEMQFTETQRKL